MGTLAAKRLQFSRAASRSNEISRAPVVPRTLAPEAAFDRDTPWFTCARSHQRKCQAAVETSSAGISSSRARRSGQSRARSGGGCLESTEGRWWDDIVHLLVGAANKPGFRRMKATKVRRSFSAAFTWLIDSIGNGEPRTRKTRPRNPCHSIPVAVLLRRPGSRPRAWSRFRREHSSG